MPTPPPDPALCAPLPTLPEWQTFRQAALHARIATDRTRILDAAGLHVDVSAQRHSALLVQAAQALLHARQFSIMRERLLQGETVNLTENRAAWHTALRAYPPAADIAAERQRMQDFIHKADTERRWRNVVHIGIGGSDWGVRLMVNAFGYAGTWRQVRFVANIDGHAIAGGLAGLDPHDTLIVLASKSFTTVETLENGRRARQWLQAAGVESPTRQMVAITAKPDAAYAWGIAPEHVFRLWDWVGGRFSLWSSASLTAALAVNTDVVSGMLAGASAMDQHFAQALPAHNAPVQMALAAVVNRSVLGYGSLNIAPYDFRLTYLVPYLQQLDMESLGKSVTVGGEPVGVPTGSTVWGMPGTDAQHTFFQWMHQGEGAPVDFIVCQHGDHDWREHHAMLLANCLAQREALLHGTSASEAKAGGLRAGQTPARAQWLAPHQQCEGGRPSTLIVLPKLTPYALGALLALYEHKIFVQALILGINPFDQWGVEYGKSLAKGILHEISGKKAPVATHDASTRYWIAQCQAAWPFTLMEQ